VVPDRSGDRVHGRDRRRTSYGSRNDVVIPKQELVDEATGSLEVRVGPEVERAHPARSWHSVRRAVVAHR